jgi:hypothetical protein
MDKTAADPDNRTPQEADKGVYKKIRDRLCGLACATPRGAGRTRSGHERCELNDTKHAIGLTLPPDARYLPTVMAAAESAAGVVGLDKDKSLRLNLAAEEFFLYLCRVVDPREKIEMQARGGRYFARLTFRFRAGQLDLRALNFTAVFSPEEDCGMEYGLLLASRTTDRFSLQHSKPDRFELTAEVDKTYPEAPENPPIFTYAPPFACQPGDADQLFQAARLAIARYPAAHCPRSFYAPGRFADMVADGYYRSLVALDSASRPAGLFCWREMGERSLAFCGPYVFADADRQQVATLLTDAFLEAVARSRAVCALSERATPDLPEQYFDLLGQLDYHEADGVSAHPAYYRHLDEDAGAPVWCHPDLVDFLREEYDRLAFSRDIATTVATGERIPDYSVLSTIIDRNKGLAGLLPLYPGRDIRENLAAHAAALTQRSLPNILFNMDLSASWQASMAPDLIQAGFVPKLIMPNAGVSDILIFQYAPAS